MLATVRPSLSPGVCAAATAPLMTVMTSWLLAAWVAGPSELLRLVEAAGFFGPMVILSGLVEMTFLTVVLCHVSTGRRVPLAMLLGVVTLPWTLGLLGSEFFIGRVLGELRALESSEVRSALALGVGEAMASRVLGACTSAALLLGLALGLLLIWADGAPSGMRIPRGRLPARTFTILAAVTLATLAAVGAAEAHQLYKLLTGLPQVPLLERADYLEQAADAVTRLRPVRWGGSALLATLAFVSLAGRARRDAPHALGWVENSILLAAITALLLLDVHPLRSATQGARAAGLTPALLPADFEALHTTWPQSPRPLLALATPEGLTPAGGTLLPWSTPAKALGQALSSRLHAASPQVSHAPGLTPEPLLALAADARLSGEPLRRLLEATTSAGAHSVELVGQMPDAASPPTLRRLEAQIPLFSLLVASPGAVRLLLPSALPPPLTVSWRARIEGSRLHLASVEGGSSFSLPLQAPAAQVPMALAGTLVGLELAQDVSLQQLGAAAELLEQAGASPVMLPGTQTRLSPPARSGTSPPRRFFPHEQRVEGTAQSSQTHNAMPTRNPRPSTTIASRPSLDDTGTFGAPWGTVGPRSGSAGVGGATGGRGRSASSAKPPRSSSPSRARASTRFMWRM